MGRHVMAATCAAILAVCTLGSGPRAFSADSGYGLVTTGELKAMMDAKKDFVLVNALSHIEFLETKIAGAVNIPYGHLLKGEEQLPPDREKTLIFYCMGPK